MPFSIRTIHVTSLSLLVGLVLWGAGCNRGEESSPGGGKPSQPAAQKPASAPAGASASSDQSGVSSPGAAQTGNAASTSASDKASEKTSGDVIKIGSYGSLSGSEATFGQSCRKGFLMAFKEQNAAGGIKGRKLELKMYDDQGKSQEAGTCVTRLITDDKVVAVLGEFTSSMSIAGGRVAQQFGVPMISSGATNAKVTQVGDMIFRVCFIDSFQGYVCAKFAVEQLKATKVATLYDQSQAYSQGLRGDFNKALTELGGKVVTEQAYSGGDQDFSAQLTTIRDSKPDAIFLPGYYTDVGNIALQTRKLGITLPLLGGDGWDSVKLAEIAGPAVEGCYYSNHYSFQDTRPEVQEFVKKFKTEYNEVPDAQAALAYDSAGVLFDSLKRAASFGGKDLAKAISETRDFPGVTGKITIDEFRNARKPAVMLQMKNNQPVFFSRVDPPSQP